MPLYGRSANRRRTLPHHTTIVLLRCLLTCFFNFASLFACSFALTVGLLACEAALIGSFDAFHETFKPKEVC